MGRAIAGVLVFIIAGAPAAARQPGNGEPRLRKGEPTFQTSDRCMVCHNGLTTSRGEDVSIGFEWRAGIMANSSRDPYWQASVRREVMDHPESKAHIEDECSTCHMPVTRYEARLQGKNGEVFAHLPFASSKSGKQAADGVNCSVCHQIGKENLGTRESFSGGFVIDPPRPGNVRPEYGPFDVDPGHQRIMRTSTEGFQPVSGSEHIQQSELCATCHTLYTTAFGPGGKVVGELPEQMPFLEWLRSDYKDRKTCQSCHMPAVEEPVPITRVFGVPREGLSRHTFFGANFFMLGILNVYRGELDVAALPQELSAAAEGTLSFLQTSAARVSITAVDVEAGRIRADVFVDNLTGHKLPTAYPSRRAWVNFIVRDRNGRVVFESGALRPDGSIVGNDNDEDAARFEPHYREITSSDQVQIYEDIIGDPKGNVTTGLLTGVGYLKDNRLLPHGFDKHSATKDISVIGDAATDPDFTGEGDRIRYAIPLGDAQGPFRIEAALWYQPIGFRWANNLKPYARAAEEPRRFTRYFDEMGTATAVTLARAEYVERGR